MTIVTPDLLKGNTDLDFFCMPGYVHWIFIFFNSWIKCYLFPAYITEGTCIIHRQPFQAKEPDYVQEPCNMGITYVSWKGPGYLCMNHI